MIEFGLDLGRVFALVDEEVARRWEVSSTQLLERSLANLHERAARIEPQRIIYGVLSGYGIRLLHHDPHWASSLVLDEAALFKLFGAQDQVLATPTRACLMSLPVDTPPRLVADIVVDMEVGQLHPLLLDRFVIEDQEILWGGNMDDIDDWTS